MLTIKIKETFCASHRLFNPLWTDEKNFSVYGKCSYKHGHGHNYLLEVCVIGEIDKETGMVIDFVKLSEIIYTQIIEDVDHKHLNFDVPWLANKVPTAEIFLEAIWERLQEKFLSLKTNVKLSSVTIWETEKNSVTKTC